MSENKIQKRPSGPIKEKGQYLLAFGVIASMLLVAGFPVFVIFFFGVFAYFLWKIFSSGSRNESRDIFEFYLAANDILRDDERRWYGFEVRDVITRGERILQTMSSPPPLVYFALGALYAKSGDHSAAVQNLAYVLENEDSGESNYMHPSAELRSYVRVLRKIEREPGEAPMTSAAVRALERARKNRGPWILKESREILSRPFPAEQLPEPVPASGREQINRKPELVVLTAVTDSSEGGNGSSADPDRSEVDDEHRERIEREAAFNNRKPISEVLHDIYDKNIQ